MAKRTTIFGLYGFRAQGKKASRSSPRGSFFPKITDIQNTRSGSKLSRFFRHFFEKSAIKTFLGGNLAMVAITVSVVTPSVSALAKTAPITATEINTITVEQPLQTDVVLQYPLEKVKINQHYSSYHLGIDFGDPVGEPIRPIMKGTVQAVEHSSFGYGNSVVLTHPNGYGSRYAHLSKINIVEGEDVDTRTVIGLVGATGRATGPHLHLEIYKDGRTINPLSLLPRTN